MAFTLRIFESEFKEIQDFVSKYPNIETGGDLFGLWQANEDPVVQLIIGPGQNCRRTSVSFHQDTNYLAKFGTFVNSSYMLCHIGSWHSHHQLSLTQPSAGDRSTVCNNFPEGLQRYIMIIANIGRGSSGRHSVDIHPYMFTKGGHVCRQGNVQKIPGRSPFRDVGDVISRLYQGAEHVLMDNIDHLSRVPSEYHQRPSTRSRPMSHASESVTKSHSPMKVEFPSHQWTESSHNILTNDTAHSPMEVDSSDNPRVAHNQQKRSPEDTNEEMQWYETEEGGSKIKEIHQEIIGMTRDIDYHRDSKSRDLTMQFTHYGQKWIVNFPKSFDAEPAVIEDSTGKFVQSKNVAKSLREACKCARCRDHEIQCRRDRSPSPLRRDRSPSPMRRDRSPSPSRRDRPGSPLKQDHYSSHPNRPQSRSAARSPPRPWYNTQRGKTILEGIKRNIQTITNVNRVRVRDTSTSKELIFYHNYRDWIIELVNSPEVINMKIEEYGRKKVVAKLSSPYDIVSELSQHCLCTQCRAARQPQSGQRRSGSALARPNSSRYLANDVVCPAPRRSASPTRDKFFANVTGEEKFKRICNDISTFFLSGGQVDMSRDPPSKDIELEFGHGAYRWKLKFSFNFPKQLPQLSYIRLSGTYDYPISIRNVQDIFRKIRINCGCRSCRTYPIYH